MNPAPQEIAEACRASMWAQDDVARNLGMEIVHTAPGEASLTMTVTQAMTNPHGTAHGGYIYILADTAFAYACNSHNNRVVAGHCSITYIAPARTGTCLTAIATEQVRFGRNGIYDVAILNDSDELIAEFRGHSRTVKGLHVNEEPGNVE